MSTLSASPAVTALTPAMRDRCNRMLDSAGCTLLKSRAGEYSTHGRYTTKKPSRLFVAKLEAADLIAWEGNPNTGDVTAVLTEAGQKAAV